MAELTQRTQTDLVDDVVEVCRALVPHRVEWFHDEVTREVAEGVLRGRDGTDLADPDARRDLTAALWTGLDVAAGRPVRDRTRAFVAKVALVVADLRDGRADWVQPWEAAAAGKVLGLDPTLRIPSSDTAGSRCENAGAQIPVEFVFPWRPSPVRTQGRLGTAAAHTSLAVVDPAEAPVACTLWTPRGRMDVRRLGTQWLRPVLSPGSWRPVDAAGFAMATSSGRAWRDNPFLPRTGRCAPTFDLADVAASRTWGRGDERRVTDARDACLARAGRLFVVEGVVHRTTSAPRAGVGTVFLEGVGRTGPTWVMGDLESTSSMDTLGHLEPPGATWCNAQTAPDHEGRLRGGRDLLALADWTGVVEHFRTTPGDRWHRDGPWPGSVADLVDVRGPVGASDVPACLATAERCARGLSLVMLRDMHGSDPKDHRGSLKRVLSMLLAEGGFAYLDNAGMAMFSDLCRRVSSRGSSPQIALDGMWTYVAAIGAHAATHELGLREVDEEVTGLCI